MRLSEERRPNVSEEVLKPSRVYIRSTEASRPNVIKRKFDTRTFVAVIMLHLAASYAILRVFIHGYSVTAWVAFIVFWVVIGLIGTSLGAHRYFTHKTFRCSLPMQYLMATLHGLSVQGSLETWMTNHFFHHVYEDIPGKDPHTPYEYNGSTRLRIKGFLWSHLAWTFYDVVVPDGRQPPKRLKTNSVIVWEKKWNKVLTISSFILPALVTGWVGSLVGESFLVSCWDGFWLAGILRITFHLHASWGVNSIGHMYGQKLDGESRNNFILAIFTFGEGFHANHHRYPNSAEFAWRWYHYMLESGTWVIRCLEMMKIVWNVGRPKKLVEQTASQ